MDHDAHQAMADMASKQTLSRDTLERMFDEGRYQNPPYAEMACTAGDDDSWLTPNGKIAAWLGGAAVVLLGSWVCWIKVF